MKYFLIIILLPFISFTQNSRDLIFESDCITMHIRLDSSSYELYTDGDGGKNGRILETGHVEWEQGTFTEVNDTLVFTSEEPIEFNTMISLKLIKTDSIKIRNYYFTEKIDRKTQNYWEVIWVENKKFNDLSFSAQSLYFQNYT